MRRLLLVLFAATVLAACGGDDGTAAEAPTQLTEAPSAGLETVTVVLDWTPNTNHAGIYVADALGYYEEAGLEVDIIQPGEGGALPALGGGRAEFAISVQEEIIPARAEGVPVVSVAAIIQHNTSSLMALADSGIEGPADLADRRYGGFGGLLEREIIESLVECEGADPSGIEFVEVGNVDFRVGLEQGHFDFVWIFEGWDGILLSEIQDVDIVTMPFIEHLDCIPDWYTPLIATRENLIEDEPGLVAAFVEATARGYEYAIEHPEEAAEILLAAAPELDEELVERSAAYLAGQYAADAPQWGWQEAEVWETFEAFLGEAGLVEEAIDVEAAYTNEFLPTPGG